MSAYEIRRFDYYDPTVVQLSITNNYVKMRYMTDAGDAVPNPVEVSVGGHKFDVLGTYKASSTPGSVTAGYLVDAGNQQLVNLAINTLSGMRGAYGTLYGIEYTASGIATHTATARCTGVSVRSAIDKVGAKSGRRHIAYVDCTWERLTEWS